MAIARVGLGSITPAQKAALLQEMGAPATAGWRDDIGGFGNVTTFYHDIRHFPIDANGQPIVVNGEPLYWDPNNGWALVGVSTILKTFPKPADSIDMSGPGIAESVKGPAPGPIGTPAQPIGTNPQTGRPVYLFPPDPGTVIPDGADIINVKDYPTSIYAPGNARPSVASTYQDQVTATLNALASDVASFPTSSQFLTDAAASLSVSGPGLSALISRLLPGIESMRAAGLAQVQQTLNQWKATLTQDMQGFNATSAAVQQVTQDQQAATNAVHAALNALHDQVAASATSALYQATQQAQQAAAAAPSSASAPAPGPAVSQGTSMPDSGAATMPPASAPASAPTGGPATDTGGSAPATAPTTAQLAGAGGVLALLLGGLALAFWRGKHK